MSRSGHLLLTAVVWPVNGRLCYGLEFAGAMWAARGKPGGVEFYVGLVNGAVGGVQLLTAGLLVALARRCREG